MAHPGIDGNASEYSCLSAADDGPQCRRRHMQLSDEQKQKVAAWLADGLSISDIQKKLGTDFGVSMTYMEVRFLIGDLKLQIVDKPAEHTPILGAQPAAPAPGLVPMPPEAAAGPAPLPEDGLPPMTGLVKVSVDAITKPGALVSGQVAFSDGNTAAWHLDQAGRLGLVTKVAGYRPPQPEIIEFQAVLQDELAKLGY